MNKNRPIESISPYIKLTKIWCSMLAVITRKINVSSTGYRKHFFPDRSFIPVDYSAGTEGDATQQGVVPRTISMAPLYVCTIVHRWLDYVPGTFRQPGLEEYGAVWIDLFTITPVATRGSAKLLATACWVKEKSGFCGERRIIWLLMSRFDVREVRR